MSDLDWHDFCQKQGGRLQVSNDGENWANYTGPASGVEAYRYCRCITEKQEATTKPVGLPGWLSHTPAHDWDSHRTPEQLADVNTNANCSGCSMCEAQKSFTLKAHPPASLPASTAGRLEFLTDLLEGFELRDEDGNLTGERSEPMITKEQFARLVDLPESEFPSIIQGGISRACYRCDSRDRVEDAGAVALCAGCREVP